MTSTKEKVMSTQALFDHTGRLIPPPNPRSGYGVCDPDPEFHLIQPDIDYSVRLARAMGLLPDGLVWPSAAQFADACQAQLERLGQDEQARNALHGVHLPFCLPQIDVHNMGGVLDEVFLPALEQALVPHRRFRNSRQGDLAKMVSTFRGSRHIDLVKRLAQEPIIGTCFPVALQGFSSNAARRQIKEVPSSWILSGFDLIMAMIMYPEVFGKGIKVPAMWPLAFLGKERGYSFEVCTFDPRYISFGIMATHFYAGKACSSGLSFLG